MDGIGTSRANSPRPAWRTLYALVTLAFAPFALVEMLAPTGALRTVTQMMAAVIVVGTMAVWVRANRVALELQGPPNRGWRRATLDARSLAQPADLPPSDHEGGDRRARAVSDDERPARPKGRRHEGIAFAARG